MIRKIGKSLKRIVQKIIGNLFKTASKFEFSSESCNVCVWQNNITVKPNAGKNIEFFLSNPPLVLLPHARREPLRRGNLTASISSFF